MMDDYWDITREELDLLCELPVCGCGRPAEVYDLYRSVLRAFVERGDAVGAAGDERMFYVVAYVLDHIDAIEHGGAVTYAWPTVKGERLLCLLDQYAEDYDRTPAVTGGA